MPLAAIYDKNGDRISLTFPSVEHASRSRPDIRQWEEDPAVPGTWNGWLSAESAGPPDISIKPTAAQGSGTEVSLRSMTKLTGAHQAGSRQSWQVICWDCGDAWDAIPVGLPPELQAIRGPWPSKSAADETRDAHRRQRH
jgi:hypothetical protein